MSGSLMKHNGGLIQLILELGFDAVKYFEGNITGAAQTISISPPARRIDIQNKSDSVAVYLNITGDVATASASLVPGDNIKISPKCQFTMDFDTLTSISLVTAGGTADIEGVIGFKGIDNC